jgi:hypothetical protein
MIGVIAWMHSLSVRVLQTGAPGWSGTAKHVFAGSVLTVFGEDIRLGGPQQQPPQIILGLELFLRAWKAYSSKLNLNI